MESQTIYYNGFELTVTFSVSKYYPATLEDPAEGGDVSLEEILLAGNDTNIVDLLEPQWDEIIDQLDIDLHES